MRRENHKDLVAWQKALALAHEIHELTKSFPKSETFGLVSQLRRAAVSIPSNIAEGTARATTREFLQFLHIARGSFAELETQLILARRVQYVSENNSVFRQLDDVGKLVNAPISGLKRKAAADTRLRSSRPPTPYVTTP